MCAAPHEISSATLPPMRRPNAHLALRAHRDVNLPRVAAIVSPRSASVRPVRSENRPISAQLTGELQEFPYLLKAADPAETPCSEEAARATVVGGGVVLIFGEDCPRPRRQLEGKILAASR